MLTRAVHAGFRFKMAATQKSDLKQRVRSSLLYWKISIKTESKSDDNFITDVFRELDTLMESVFIKHDGSLPRNRVDSHRIIDICPMTARILMKIHASVLRRLRSTPTTCSPFYGTFSLEVSSEVFDVILKGIIEQNGFGHTCSSSNSLVTVKITDRKKAVYVFRRMDEVCEVDKEKMFCKEFDDKGVAKVLFTDEQPFTLKYNKSKELLTVSFHYGYWNSVGVPQH